MAGTVTTNPRRTTEALIEALVTDLRPVRRLFRPTVRLLCWTGFVAGLAVVIALTTDLDAVARRLVAAPDMWLSAAGSLGTMVAAAFAALELSLPDRSPRWSLLPVPALALWIGASGLGCLRIGLELLNLHRATTSDALRECLPFILGLSLPLGVTLGWMLRRSRPLRPGPVTVLAGLASASGAATLLWLVHPFDASVIDLVVHVVAVSAVVGVARLVSRLRPPDGSIALA